MEYNIKKITPWWVKEVGKPVLLEAGLLKAKLHKNCTEELPTPADARRLLLSKRSNNVHVSKDIKNTYEIISESGSCDNYSLSVVVCAYNVSEYIIQCLNSIVKDCENLPVQLIIVEDCSMDNTFEIINQYVKSLNLPEGSPFGISVLRSLGNQGVGHSRNVGVDYAKGEFIEFVDGDDMVCNTKELLAEAISNNLDMLIFQYSRLNIRGKIVKANKINETADVYNLPGFCWGKIIKASIVKDAPFLEGCLYEDCTVRFKLFPSIKTFKCSNTIGYIYRANPFGIMQSGGKNYKSIDAYWVTEYLTCGSDLNDIHTQEVILEELSRYVYQRNKDLSEEYLKALFVMACTLHRRLNISYKGQVQKFVILDKIFKTRSYIQWKDISQVL